MRRDGWGRLKRKRTIKDGGSDASVFVLRGSQAVIASEAKQSIVRQERMDCFVASLLAMTFRYNFAISRRVAPEVCERFPYPPVRGRRECRAPDAPASRVCNDSGRKHTRSSG